ncbi:MAG: 5-histidylcysteine sulfoxide synthase [Pseudobdellovibrionaceae bacterium]
MSQDWLIGLRPDKWWTGKKPLRGICPGVDEDGFYHSLSQLNFKNANRQDVLNYFDNTWTMTEVLFSGLQGEEAFTCPPIHQLRHPLVFYYGHPAVFYINKLRKAGVINEPLNAYFENIFEVGVDEMSWDDMSKNEMRWPEISEITEYRRKVYNLVRDLILNDPRLDPQRVPISLSTPAWSLAMSFEHERIHLETSSVLMRELPLRYLLKPLQWPLSKVSDEVRKETENWPEISLVSIEKGRVKIGKPDNFPTFGWDNEYGHRELNVAPFKVSQTLITNVQYLKFIEEGGYQEPNYWSEEGWAWRSFRDTSLPSFWIPKKSTALYQYSIRCIFDEIGFQPDWPVIINFHEAKAYCNWKTVKEKAKSPFRLLTEAEHHRLRASVKKEKNGEAVISQNINLKYGSEGSVYNQISNGISDIFGNVWQWCEDVFNPLPGFSVHPYYEDFSTPCFDGKHQMIMGGSFASTGDEAQPYARFHFRPHFFQHAGFRISQSVEEVGLYGSDYESSKLLSQYLLLHFSDPKEIFPFEFGPREALSFPQRCANLVIEESRKARVPMRSVLDLGCAVGGSSFILSQYFESVIGVDFSTSFIAAANHLKSVGEITFHRQEQGDINFPVKAKKPTGSRSERIQFLEGDACNLPPQLYNFEVVMMANLLCRLPDPKACLKSMSGKRGVVCPGGLLILFSPYSWLEQYTPKSNWLGGRMEKDLKISSSSEIKNLLGGEFNLLKTADIPLLIREHERKYQYIVSHMMVFQRKFPLYQSEA